MKYAILSSSLVKQLVHAETTIFARTCDLARLESSLLRNSDVPHDAERFNHKRAPKHMNVQYVFDELHNQTIDLD